MRPGVGGTQLADQFRQSVQAGGNANGADEGPQDGWFVGVNGVPLGPIPLGDLKELAVAGHVDRRSLVWREGQAEWRPLGKFPQLARLLDESGVSSASQARPAVSSAQEPEPQHANGAAGSPFATGFDMRPASSPEAQRPSAWGDLDEEDDDDEEQPTTVKGRVSALPPMPAPAAGALGHAALPFANELPAGVALAAAPERPAVNAADARLAAGVTGAPIASPPAAGTGGTPVVSLSLAADPGPGDLEAQALRGRGRGRIYAFVIVAVASLALVWTLRHVLWSGSNSEPSRAPSEPAHTQAAPEPSPSPVQASSVSTTAVAVSSSPPGGQGPRAVGAGPGTSTSVTDSARGADDRAAHSKVALAPPALASVVATNESTKPAATSGTSDAKGSKTSTGALLSTLGTAQAPVVAGPHASGDALGSAGALDATTLQRTVRRYAPAVKQSCWQRALSARAPGVPSSAKVTATITVDAAGHVSSVEAAGAPRGYPGLGHCIEDAVKTWQFPRAAGETTTTVPFIFVGQ